MADDTSKRRENDARQSGAGDPGYGQDARDFGAGGQTVSGPVEGNPKDRDPARDRSLNPVRRSESPAKAGSGVDGDER